MFHLRRVKSIYLTKYILFKIEILEDIKHRFPVFFFDSTGTINKEIIGQNLPFFYSVTMYNENKKCYIPMVEFFTTDQSQRSVTQFLTSAMFIISEYQKSKQFNQELIRNCIFVTDQSSVLINSVLKVINKCNLSQYIQWTFDIIMGGKDDISYFKLMKTLIYYCATHFLKNVLKKTKKFTNNVKVKKAFVFCFSLIQNATDLGQIENYIDIIFTIFDSKFQDENVQSALDLLDQEIQSRQLNYLYHSINKKNIQLDKSSETLYIIKPESKNEIYVNSPYTKYYDKIFKNKKNLSFIKNDNNKKDKNKKLIDNLFYCPNLISIIEEQMFSIPLWSGLMLKVFEIQNQNRKYLLPEPFTRLTNNPVETRIRIVKNNILKIERKNKKRKRCTLNEIKSKLFKNVKAIHKRYFKSRRRNKV